VSFVCFVVHGSSLNYLGEYGSGYSLCSSMDGSEHSVSPQGQKDTENLRFKFTHTK